MAASYDRELIAQMLEGARRGDLHQFSVESIERAISQLRAADNADAAGVHTARRLPPDGIHTCSYQCDQPECIRAQRDDLAAQAERDAAEIVRLRGEVESLRGQIHDEIAANLAFREAGGALPDEDMPTFCARLLAERDATIAPAEAKGDSDACNCPGGSKPDPEKHAPNCPVRTLPCRTLVNQFDTPQPAGGEAVARDREADRARFADAAFNNWLDEGISDSGHTIWDAVGDVSTAWSGWCAREFYATPPAVQVQQEAVSEVACDMHYLMGRASRDGHEVGQRLASEVKAKLESALAQAPAVRVTDEMVGQACEAYLAEAKRQNFNPSEAWARSQQAKDWMRAALEAALGQGKGS